MHCTPNNALSPLSGQLSIEAVTATAYLHTRTYAHIPHTHTRLESYKWIHTCGRVHTAPLNAKKLHFVIRLLLIANHFERQRHKVEIELPSVKMK